MGEPSLWVSALISPSTARDWLFLGRSWFSPAACLMATVLTMPPRICFPQMMKGCWFGTPPVASCSTPVPPAFLHAPTPSLLFDESAWIPAPSPQSCCNSSTLSGAEFSAGKNIRTVCQAPEFKHIMKTTYQWVVFKILQYKGTHSPPT